jgi:negative regulator of sigma-B (phosphoserine phosphatase)
MSRPFHEEPVIEWGSAGRAVKGVESGDAHIVATLPDGALVGVIDGLGHGPDAAAAAQKAVETLRDYADEPILALVQRCHESLRSTRGAVMSLASFNAADSSVTLIGIGNVEGVLLRAGALHSSEKKQAISLRGGVVGYKLPPLRAETVPVSPGDTLIMATDGIRSGFTTGVVVGNQPQHIAESILSGYFKHSDDALVFVARYLGKPL